MKLTTKFWLYASLISLLPIFFSTLMIAMISFEWLLTDQSKFAQMFLTGEFNRDFATFMFGIGVFGLSVIFTTIMTLFQKASKIDKLDEAIFDAYEAKRKYEAATRKIVEEVK